MLGGRRCVIDHALQLRRGATGRDQSRTYKVVEKR